MIILLDMNISESFQKAVECICAGQTFGLA